MGETKWYWIMFDGWTMTQRNMKKLFRQADSLLMSIALPVVLMLMYVYIFGGAIQTGTEYINYMVPGVIITCVAFGSSLIASNVTQDKIGGLFERFRSMPIRPSSLLTGHVIGGMVRNGLATTITFLVALLIGFRPNSHLLDWIAIIAVLALFIFSVSWLFVLLGLLAKSVDTANMITFPMLFLPNVSSAFVPTETMPNWLQIIAENQPLTPLIETLRGLLIGTPIDNNLWLAVAWFGGLLIGSMAMATFVFKRQRNE